ncbi:cytochrome C oxidase subunit IV family protein [Pseudomonas sp. TCU-HL1]|uniref:cytochrome C oxidase subunit IV family protein n=1 Tax=Pseudomonas sp. TCU-HL1 TaxID=1856685 RepID=UPI00083D7350|nr:cytochrome C oxidase subunit IV family protein [Pseudomonas sp. TCU-HL1]AOE86763.1 prokaryotic cytochrome C oxidase subunitIV family protein [Pseudomonas sp. TCU-HL1]
MSANVRENVTAVWVLLLVITVGSWALGTHLLGESLGRILAPASILALALIKARLVILHFMEVRHAPAAIRQLCSAWLVVVFGGLLWFYC